MRIAVYPGSFDPPTCGHEDILKRASTIFDRLYVTVFSNPLKTGTFSIEDRVEMLKDLAKHMSNVTVDSCTQLLVDYAREKGAGIIVRGLRAVSDFDYEFTMALMNKKLAPEVETIFIMTNPEYLYLSSSKVKELASFGADIRGLVPPDVEARLRHKYSK
jgi:pantetheine-phosphate adenylyltransferase